MLLLRHSSGDITAEREAYLTEVVWLEALFQWWHCRFRILSRRFFIMEAFGLVLFFLMLPCVRYVVQLHFIINGASFYCFKKMFT